MIVIVLFLLLFFLCFVKLRLCLFGTDGSYELRLMLGRFLLLRRRLILIRRAEILPFLYLEEKKQCRRIFPKAGGKKPSAFAKRMIRSCSVERLHINAVIGTGDAAATAITAGLLRNAAALLRDPAVSIRIAPDFEGECLKIGADCIVSLRIADIIGKTRKGGKNNASYRKHTQEHHG